MRKITDIQATHPFFLLFFFGLGQLFVGIQCRTVLADYTATLQRPKISTDRIQNIHFNTTAFIVKVKSSPEPRDTKITAKFWGLLREKEAQLKLNNEPLSLEKENIFSQEVELLSQETPLEIEKTNAKGEIEKETIKLIFKDYLYLKMGGLYESASVLSLGLSVGTALITYTQTGMERFDQVTSTLRGSFHYRFPRSQWTVGGNVFSTVMPFLTTTMSSILQSETLRFFGSNVRVGYILPWQTDHWTFCIMAGIYYTTTFSSNLFGYAHYKGFQLYPTLRETFADKSSITLFLKFSPVTNGLTLYIPNNYEVAAGAAYSFPPNGNETNWAISLDFTSLTLTTPVSSVNTFSNVFSLGYVF